MKHTRSTGVDNPSSGSGDDRLITVHSRSDVDAPVFGGQICLRQRSIRDVALVLYTTHVSHLSTERYKNWIYTRLGSIPPKVNTPSTDLRLDGKQGSDVEYSLVSLSFVAGAK